MIKALIRQTGLLLFVFLSHIFFLNAGEEASPCILVSVAPHKFFVEKIAKGTVQVQLLVPAGASSHTYEPTPKQMVTASHADIWFQIGETFEKRATQALKSHHPNLKLVDLRHGVDLIHPHHSHCPCCQDGVDLHFWLSTRQAEIQAETITNTLIQHYPKHAETYRSNLQGFKNELKNLDQEIQTILAPLENRNILVSHPAYAYFCRDYSMQQHAIEMEGKDPTPQQMTKLLNLVRQLKLHAIFIQMQYNNKAAKLVAETLGAQLVTLDPYSEYYYKSMLEIAHAFANQ